MLGNWVRQKLFSVSRQATRCVPQLLGICDHASQRGGIRSYAYKLGRTINLLLCPDDRG